ncbi:hypothetical protein ACFYTS_34030 [Nocardia sp. NPDC004151]|uniref:hypothetical protein n=1 Tax=Nocardia sp. NPDC004151 TaxID=3364304 RepID=UPI00368B70A3
MELCDAGIFLILAGSELHTELPMTARPRSHSRRISTSPVPAIFVGHSVVPDVEFRTRRARKVLRDGRGEVLPRTLNVINGEFPEKNADRVERFLTEVE